MQAPVNPPILTSSMYSRNRNFPGISYSSLLILSRVTPYTKHIYEFICDVATLAAEVVGGRHRQARDVLLFQEMHRSVLLILKLRANTRIAGMHFGVCGWSTLGDASQEVFQTHLRDLRTVRAHLWGISYDFSTLSSTARER